jgi:hypothetical protein
MEVESGVLASLARITGSNHNVGVQPEPASGNRLERQVRLSFVFAECPKPTCVHVFGLLPNLRPVFDTHVLVYVYIGIVQGIPVVLVTTRDPILFSGFHVSVIGF